MKVGNVVLRVMGLALLVGSARMMTAQDGLLFPPGGERVHPEAIMPYQLGESVSGELTANAPYRAYRFSGQAGNIITITMASDEIDTYLQLGDADGLPLAEDDDNGERLDARLGPLVLPADGDYFVIASTFEAVVSDGAETKPGTFTLSSALVDAEAVTYPDETRGELAADEDFRLYRFDGQAGDILAIGLVSRDFDALLTVVSAGGSAVPVRDDDGGEGANALIRDYVVPETGSYLIIAEGANTGAAGAFRLEISQWQPEPMAYGETVEAALVDETPLLLRSFEAQAGDVIDVLAESPVDTVMTLLGPDGRTIVTVDDTNGTNPAISGLQLDAPGTYTVIVRRFRGSDDGDVQLTLTRLPAASP